MTQKLPETTTDRLLAVADRIEFEPEHWDQDTWFDADDGASYWGDPGRIIGKGDDAMSCGTTACIAGWATLLTPRSELVSHSFVTQGAHSLGITAGLANVLFSCNAHEALPEVLRRLAKAPEPRGLVPFTEALDELGVPMSDLADHPDEDDADGPNGPCPVFEMLDELQD